MTELASVACAACAAALICTLASSLSAGEASKRIISLVLGAFMVCCLLAPVSRAFSGLETDGTDINEYSEQSTDDEAYRALVISKTKENLESTLCDLLLQNGVVANKCEVTLALRNETSIIISSICIYIGEEYIQYSGVIENVTFQNFGITPNIITE